MPELGHRFDTSGGRGRGDTAGGVQLAGGGRSLRRLLVVLERRGGGGHLRGGDPGDARETLGGERREVGKRLGAADG